MAISGTENEASQVQSDDQEATRVEPAPLKFTILVIVVFGWCILGLALIYGVRVWWDLPPHPHFAPFMAVGFAVIVAFTIVMMLRYATEKEIEFVMPGGLSLKGASGPITLWAICFLCIVFAFYLLGIGKTLDEVSSHKSVPFHKLPAHFADGNEAVE